jgi:hypothetical protein
MSGADAHEVDVIHLFEVDDEGCTFFSSIFITSS